MSEQEKDRDREREEASVAMVPSDTLAQPRRVISGHIHWRHIFAAFQHRNYRIFFFAQAVSLIGTWMQTVAEGWLVYQLSDSPFVLGLTRFLHTIPVTLFSFYAGALADRMEKRTILLATQSASMVLALCLGLLVYMDWVEVWHVAVLALLLGTAHAFDIPSRQSFVVEMVGKKDLMNAIALNSSVFNGARVVGPAVAGLIIGAVGIAACFFVNAVSFLAVILGYLMMRLPRRETRKVQAVGPATREAFQYLWRHPVLRPILGMISVVSLFGWPYSILMPVFARDVLDVGAKGYGYLMAANGFGAFMGAITLASLGDYPNKRRLSFGGLFGFSGMLLIFALSKHVWLSATVLACAGWFMIIFFATANTLVQTAVPDELRGRVMGIYSFCFIGISPLGSLAAGALARVTSAPAAVAFGAVVCIGAGILVSGRVRRREGGQEGGAGG